MYNWRDMWMSWIVIGGFGFSCGVFVMRLLIMLHWAK